ASDHRVRPDRAGQHPPDRPGRAGGLAGGGRCLTRCPPRDAEPGEWKRESDSPRCSTAVEPCLAAAANRWGGMGEERRSLPPISIRSPAMQDAVVKEVESRMTAAIDALSRELAGVRT